jgi:phenylpropionate dioxygenase-like ring-hydroxylating dioxygenase large terminal subunit
VDDPLRCGAKIPKLRYLSPDFLRVEIERVFRRTWHMAGPVADLNRVGAYFTFDIGGESALVVRTAEGVCAMHNVCVHRGRALCEPGLGYVQSFRCPFHHWEYELDGRVRRITDAAAFPASAASLRLTPVSAEVFEGFVWLSFAPDAEPLESFLGPIAARLAAYRLADYALVEDTTLELECNWKVAADAFNEAYHLRAVHPQLLQVLDETRVEIELVDRHCCIRVPVGSPSPNWSGPPGLGNDQRHLLREAGIDPEQFSAGPAAVRAAVQHALRTSTQYDFSGMSDAQLTDNHYFFVFPSTSLSIYGLRAMALRYRPHPTDPGRMLLDHQEYVRVPAGAARPPRPPHVVHRAGEGSLGTVNDQDIVNLIRVQRGMASSGFDALFTGAHEVCIRHMHAVLDCYIDADSTGR